jgi:hypothetical protein
MRSLVRGGDAMRLDLILHLDHVGQSVGGGWAIYDMDGDLMASSATPGWEQPLTPFEAAGRLLDEAEERVWIQQTLPL